MNLTTENIVMMAIAAIVIIILLRKVVTSMSTNKGRQSNYPYEVPIVNSGNPNDSQLLKIKRIYAKLYGVDVASVTDDTQLGSLYADIIVNITFQLGVVTRGNAITTIKELVDVIRPPKLEPDTL